MATTSSLLGRGLGLVLVEFQYEYKDRDGTLVSIKPNERYVLLAKTNDHWWQVRSDHNSKPFYIPAKYVKELPTDLPLPLDFADPPSAEPVPVPVATPVPVPVPVPVPKTLEETSGSRTKPGDEVTIRLRPDGYRKTENRMSTFGVPLDFHDLSHLVVPAPRHPGNSHADSTETGNIITSRTTNMVDSVSKKQSHLTGVLDSNKDPGKLRVPNFSPSDPLSVPRPHTQPIPVVLPVIPAVPVGPVLPVVPAAPGVSVVPAAPGVSVVPAAPGVSVVPAATLAPDVNLTPVIHPHKNPHSRSSPSTSCHDNHSSTVDSEKEEELLEEEVSMEESGEEEESFPKDEDSNHIYESIQDLNLDVEALTGARPGALSEPAPAPAPAQNHSSPGPNTAIYANVSSLKKSSVPQISISSPISPPPPPSEPAPTPPLHTPSSTVSSSGMMSPTSPLSPQDGWQVHTDQDSGKVFYYHPGTKQSTWSDPHSPPSLPAGDVDQFRRIEERQLSSTSSQPPLPEEDYPVEEPDGNDVVFTHPQQQNVGLIPRAQLDLKDGNRRLQEVPHLPQRLLGNGVSQEETPLQVMNWRHNVAEDTFAPGHRRNVSDLTEVTNRRHSPDGPQGHLLEKAGIINKTKVADHGKKIRKNWGQSWTVLHGGILTFHKDPKSNPTGNAMKSSQIVPEYTVELKGAAVSWASKDKSSKKNVLELKTRQGCEYLMQYDTESVISDWHRVILDAIKQLEHDHLTEDEEEDALEKEGKDKKRTSTTNSSSTAESEQRQVRTKLRRFLQRRPTLQNVKDKGYIRDNIFGCHLDTLCHRENSTIPKFVEKCIKSVERRGLDVDGIYRVSGNLAVIQKLRYKVDREEQLDLEDGQWEEIHVITGALKLFLRELPEPLFPFSCFDKFIAAIQVPDYSLRVSYMKDLVRSLPLPNHDTMELLFKHLRKVIEHKDSNRMSVQSVAIVFGPTLLRPETESADMTIHMVFQSQIVELILKEFQTIFSQK
ncbi:rho GTPase-activating protein 27 isoform X2 [Anabas testudineus]|uniref:Rho GTPase activating protein 27, like n=1 Tax=Anabas testudineus TaxID=64144 RepID=A0A3Q1IXJ7_ANATE|nr:rho GTPase-activating protein 27 isoform X2 [Anabas testudineus]